MITSDLLPSIGTFITGIVVAIVSARVTVQLALKRFHSEKWWELKVDAYGAIIEALHHVRNHADTNLAFLARGKELPENGDALLTQKLEDAMAELRKQYDIGNFVISTEAVSAMDTLMKELNASTKNVTWGEHLELKLGAVDKCLVSMRKLARTDLQLQ